jgi:MFS family permease
MRFQRFSSGGTPAVVCLATAMPMLDIAVVNTALPRIATDLHSGLTGIEWIVAYTPALAAVVLTAGSVACSVGRRLSSRPAWGSSRRRPSAPLSRRT